LNLVLMVAMGGAAGSVARYLFVKLAGAWLGPELPYGTLGVNVIGSLLAGLLYVVLIERVADAAEWRALLMVGVLGGFTTFSAFSVDTMRLLEESGLAFAAGNAAANLCLSLLACAVGIWMGRQWL